VTHKAVALKFLHKKNDDPDARRRVLREARAACAVQHPNVVSVHDVVEDEDGTPILVMDLLRGESLADKLTRERTLSPAEAVTIIGPVLSALAVAHSVGIVHRDLKPDNIFLMTDGSGASSRPMVLDFGVAKLVGKGANAATKETNRLTETGAMIGTPHYMAPEQAFGESDVDARADLWALGAVLYEMLSGFTPADGQNLGQILKVLASGTITPLATRAPNVPPALAAIVDGLLKIEKDERPASAAIVLEQLAAIGPQSAAVSVPVPVPVLSDDEIAAAAASPAPARPHTVPSLVAATREASLASPKRRRRAPWIAGIAAVVALASAAGVTGVRLRAKPAHASSNAPVSVVATSVVTADPTPTPAPPPPAVAATATVTTPPAATASAAPMTKRTKGGSTKPTSPAAPAANPIVKPSGGTPLINEPTF
jgi:serine/threonine protein kinase